MTGLGKTIARKFDDEIKFFRGWIDKPREVGSIIPTSSITARKMASIVNPASGLPVLELGPGTGVITKAILATGLAPEKLYSIEYFEDFVEHLQRLFPRANVRQGDAFDLDTALGEARDLTFDCAISGVPLLNFPAAQRVRYVEGILDRLPIGRPIVQLTYGPFSPVPPRQGNYVVEHFDFIIRNIPPTRLWLYRRAAAA